MYKISSLSYCAMTRSKLYYKNNVVFNNALFHVKYIHRYIQIMDILFRFYIRKLFTASTVN